MTLSDLLAELAAISTAAHRKMTTAHQNAATAADERNVCELIRQNEIAAFHKGQGDILAHAVRLIKRLDT